MFDEIVLDATLMVVPTLVILVIFYLLYRIRAKGATESSDAEEELPPELEAEESEDEEPPELKDVPPATDEDVNQIINELEKTSNKILSEKVGKQNSERGSK
jgi:flagellar biosynthesis/type III secretory pathway M-ring protein FliF/YscJ